jgi:hypothetical protein
MTASTGCTAIWARDVGLARDVEQPLATQPTELTR